MSLLKQFCNAATAAGAVLIECKNQQAAVTYIAEHAQGGVLVPVSASIERAELNAALLSAGVKLLSVERRQAEQAAAGVTSACFGIADTGTLVLESTAEDVRLASTLPTRHFVILDPSKMLADGLAAVGPLRKMHQQNSRNYIAYITGPSRTADIERVLTIGVHGPKELYILLLDEWSADLLEM
ncbi:LutC/YkgG family protein [Geopsychrobacter electrodiphilus]|uniref:LutC/YkgG family protein n=1 Tax=Geopsychrobacter electrodiphilus TaxID=225196 RepID=UPI00037B4D64|nr:lactate utilization protein [Geopsychrobacter electrodiphilus]